MKKILSLLLFAATTLGASAQLKENPVSVTLDIHECYIEQSFTTTDQYMLYYVSYLEKDLFDEQGYNDDETLANADKTWFEEMAAGYEADVQEVVEGFSFQGDAFEFQTDLLPDHDYVLWVHGVDEQGNATTTITRVPFHTNPVQAIPNRIDLKAEMTADGVKVVCTPDDNDLYYTLGSVVKENMVDEFTGEELSLRDYMQYGFSKGIYDYLAGDEFYRIFEVMANKGPQTIVYNKLEQGVEYYIVAAYLDDEAGICSEIATVEIDANGNLTSVNGIHNAASTAKSVYNINGTRVSESLDNAPAGVYIVREGGHTRKIVKRQ